MRAQLVPIDGGETISITRDVTLVGRQRGLCDVFLDRSSISKLHCLIVRTDGLLFIRDLGSTNGTKVNGQRVTRGALLPGDVLAFASEKYRIEMGPGDPDDVPADARTEVLESLVASEIEPDYSELSNDPPPDENVRFDEYERNEDSKSDVRLLDDQDPRQ